MEQKGVFVILSGNSGTGKNFFQDIILKSNSIFKQVPKFISRDAREGEDTSVDRFGVDKSVIEKGCTWTYSRSGNAYGFNETDVLDIINAGNNAIVIATNDVLSYRIRKYCIDNGISLLKIHLQDKSIDFKNVGQTLSSKGRTEKEVEEREGKERWKLAIQFLEQDFCDYGINNRYDITSNTWEKSGEELLTEFNSYFEEFLLRQQLQERCFEILDSKSPNKAKKAYLEERWINGLVRYGIYGIGYGLEGKISHIAESEMKSTTIISRQLGAEHHMQRWLDKIWMHGINSEIIGAVRAARDGNLTENDMDMRARLEAKYRAKWEELENPENELVRQFYQGLVNIVPLVQGETTADRLRVLRYPYRDKNQREYGEEEALLRRRLVEISCPYEYTI